MGHGPRGTTRATTASHHILASGGDLASFAVSYPLADTMPGRAVTSVVGSAA